VITPGVCLSYKEEILQGLHQRSHVYKMALYNDEAKLSPNTKRYSAAGEVASNGTNYMSGGQALTGFKTDIFDKSAILKFDSPVEWPQSNITACAALIYNSSLPDKNAVLVIDFEKMVTSLNDIFGVNFKNNNLIRMG
jgi:hypothetical protein